MTAGPGPGRPIGWWLKEADAKIEAAFAARLRHAGVDRRGWQVLSAVEGSSLSREDLITALASFDSATAVEGEVADLTSRGWLTEESGLLALTPDGEHAHAELAAAVAQVRERVSDALPPEDYAALIGLLQRLVAGLSEAAP